MYHVVVASANPSKINAVSHAFKDVFGDCRVEGIEVDSGVAAQPFGNEETRRGAYNRVRNAELVCPKADFWVGLEAGVEGHQTFAWMVVSNGQTIGESRSASLTLPPQVLQALERGEELGPVMDQLTGEQNIKHKGGAIAVFTHGVLSRSKVYHQALILALIPFINPQWF
ncbi:inosine/xanthosine triphosphatase [Plesiomonas shigelloides]